jgi:hypothetical protein
MHTRLTFLTAWSRRSTVKLAGLGAAALLLGAYTSLTPPPTPPMLSAQASVTSAASAGAAEAAAAELRSARGFTDSTGTEAHHWTPSSQRAEMLGTVLRDAGIAADRMSMRGVGESSPVASNQSAEDRALIRRVEIVLSDGVGPQRPR